MLKIDNISKVWGENTVNERRALDDVSLNINKGDFITVIGGNGSGKSTLLNVVSGAVSPDSGSIMIDGEDVTLLPEYKRAVYLGRVFQDPLIGSSAGMTIEENLALASRRNKKRTLSWGIKNKERVEYRELLSHLDLGLEDRMTCKVGLLSGGQRQALTLLMAAMAEPKLLLLDEHTAALDPKTAAKVLEISDKIVAENNLTTIMVTHSMQDAIKYGNRLVMLQEGKVLFETAGQAKKDLTIDNLLCRFTTSAVVNLGAEMVS